MGAKFMTIDIRNFLLSSHTPHPEFMKIHQDEILQDILDQFKAHLFIDSKGYVYFKITKGMNGIKQAAILAYITNWSRTSASMVITLFPHSRNAETPVLADHLLCLCGRFWYQVPLSRWRHPSRGALQEYCKITIDYVATHPNAVICNHRSDMVLYVDSDTGYLVLPEACSCMARQYFLSTDPTLTRTVLPNGPILTECCTIKHDVQRDQCSISQCSNSTTLCPVSPQANGAPAITCPFEDRQQDFQCFCPSSNVPQEIQCLGYVSVVLERQGCSTKIQGFLG